MQFFKNTLIGGLIFMVPVVIVFAILGKAIEIMMMVAKPLNKLIPIDSVGQIAMVNILAVLAVVLCCFFAGIIARGKAAQKVYRLLDTKLQAIPGYTFFKGMTQNMNDNEDSENSFKPVIVKFDDNTQIGFEIERSDGGNVVVYLPGAPNPWSGAVANFTADRVNPLSMTVAQAFGHMKQFGRGSAQHSDIM